MTASECEIESSLATCESVQQEERVSLFLVVHDVHEECVLEGRVNAQTCDDVNAVGKKVREKGVSKTETRVAATTRLPF